MSYYFARLQPPPALVIQVHERYISLIERFSILAATGDRTAARQARLISASYQEFNADMLLVAERTALLANRVIPGKFQSSRVRPDTGGGEHLRDALPTSEAVPTPLPAGVVGVVRLDALDKFPYWKAQEFGSDHMVGREIYGWFFGAGGGGPSAPNPNDFRTHPLFRPAANAPVKATFRNSIPEGNFLRDGLQAVEAYWTKEIQHACNDALKDLAAVAGLGRRAGGSAGGITRGRRTKNFQTLKNVQSPQGLRNFLRHYK